MKIEVDGPIFYIGFAVACGVIALIVENRENEELAICVAERDVAKATLATTRADLLDTQADLMIEKSEADECHGSWSELFDMMWECEHVDFWDRCQPLLEEQWNDFGGPNGCHEELNLVWDMRCRGDYAGIQAMLTCEGYDQQ